MTKRIIKKHAPRESGAFFIKNDKLFSYILHIGNCNCRNGGFVAHMAFGSPEFQRMAQGKIGAGRTCIDLRFVFYLLARARVYARLPSDFFLGAVWRRRDNRGRHKCVSAVDGSFVARHFSAIFICRGSGACPLPNASFAGRSQTLIKN